MKNQNLKPPKVWYSKLKFFVFILSKLIFENWTNFELWKILMHKNAIKLENSGVRGHFTTKMGPKTGDLNPLHCLNMWSWKVGFKYVLLAKLYLNM